MTLLSVCAALAALWVMRAWEAPAVTPAEGYLLQVGRGESVRTVAAQLYADGVLPDTWSLPLYARFANLDARIQAGEYRIPAALPLRELLHKLVAGEVTRYQVTLPEGVTLAQALQILWAQPALERVLEGPGDARLAAMAGDYPSAEGLFLPETYAYERGGTDLLVLQRAHAEMTESLQKLWLERAAELPYASTYEALIMASIIERETGVAAERARIAGVFVRRLRADMLLQTDPTVIYGLGQVFDGNLRREHLRDADNPYNTYRHRGLPPTPIALPGLAALRAALHPDEQDDSLYFVARGDGSHVFSATYEAHEQAVRQYQLQRRENYQSRPEEG